MPFLGDYMLNIADLERALAPIEQIGQDTLTFEVEGHTITLRPLLPREELEVQKRVAAILEKGRDEDGDIEKYTMLEYFDHYKIEILAHAIVQIDNLDLREHEWIATGEKTSSGRPVRVKRHVAMRDILLRWSRMMLSVTFNKFNKLVADTNDKAEQYVDRDVTDIDAELEALEEKKAELEAERSRRAEGDPNIMRDTLDQIREYERLARDEDNFDPVEPIKNKVRPDGQAIGQPEIAAPRPAPEPQVIKEPEWADFDEMPTQADLDDQTPEPEEEYIPEPVEMPRFVQPEPVRPPAPPRGMAIPPQDDPLSDVQDSFQDPLAEEAMAAEAERIAAMRRRQEMNARLHQAPAPEPPQQVPPHMRGARLGEDMPSMQEYGEVDGVPAFRMDTGELSGRGRGHAAPQEKKVPVNQRSSGTRNRRFRPVNKG